MTKKRYDIVLKAGEYTDQQGNTKGRWQNVGAVLVNDEDKPFIVLERWFNPAGVPNPDDRTNVMLSLFEPNRGQQGGQQQSENPAPPADDFDDSIPF